MSSLEDKLEKLAKNGKELKELAEKKHSTAKVKPETKKYLESPMNDKTVLDDYPEIKSKIDFSRLKADFSLENGGGSFKRTKPNGKKKNGSIFDAEEENFVLINNYLTEIRKQMLDRIQKCKTREELYEIWSYGDFFGDVPDKILALPYSQHKYRLGNCMEAIRAEIAGSMKNKRYELTDSILYKQKSHQLDYLKEYIKDIQEKDIEDFEPDERFSANVSGIDEVLSKQKLNAAREKSLNSIYDFIAKTIYKIKTEAENRSEVLAYLVNKGIEFAIDKPYNYFSSPIKDQAYELYAREMLKKVENKGASVLYVKNNVSPSEVMMYWNLNRRVSLLENISCAYRKIIWQNKGVKDDRNESEGSECGGTEE